MNQQKSSLPAPDAPALPEDDTLELSASQDALLPDGEKRENVDVPPISISIGADSTADTVMATQAIINRQALRLDGLRDDMQKVNESLKSILDNDAELSSAEMELKEAAKKQKERKAKLVQSAESMQLKYKLKEIREQVVELEESLNNHLLNYYQLTGTKVFDTDDGGQREFKVMAKMLARKHKKGSE